jgi:AraC family ethanolamine operon transcriptional activator
VPDWQPPVSEITSFEFRDFDSFREHLHGWDTDPVQLDAGPLRLRWDQLRLEDFGLARLQVNRRIADTSAVEPGFLGFSLGLEPMRWCGLEVPAGSLLVLSPGRDQRSTLRPGFRSVEITASEKLLHEAGILADAIHPPALPPERCVVPLGPGLVGAFEELARRLHHSAGNGGSPSGATALRHRALHLLRSALQVRGIPGIRPVPRFDLASAALRLVEDNGGDRLSVQELVQALGVTRRALEYAFSSALEVSPAKYLRARRLNQVRRDLHARAPLSVTDAALCQGFRHLGRFSGQYRRLFCELPSQTRRSESPQMAATSADAGPLSRKQRKDRRASSA